MTIILAIICILCMIGLVAHVQNNTYLDKKAIGWFKHIFVIVALLTSVDLISLIWNYQKLPGAYYVTLICVLIYYLLFPMNIAGFPFAFSEKKVGKIFLGISALFDVYCIAAFLSGNLFTVGPNGEFYAGSLSKLTTFFQVMIYALLLVILFIVSRRYERNKRSLLYILFLILPLCVLPALLGIDTTLTFVVTTFTAVLTYMFCDHTTQQSMIRDIQAQSDKIREMSEQRVREENERRLQNEHMTLQLIEAFTRAVDAKDRYTNGHSFRVAEYSVLLAKKLGWDEEQLKQLRYEALLHDVGKIGIPDMVLNKAGRLNDIEYNIIKSHTTMGYSILEDVDTRNIMKCAAQSHHERYDGRGYPEGLKGEDIPLDARIISIADAYDAMYSDRIYRKKLSLSIVRDEMVKGSGTQFDPVLLESFLELMDEGALVVPEIESKKDMAIVETEERFIETLQKLISERMIDSRDLSGADENVVFEDLEKTLKGKLSEQKISCGIAELIVRPKAGKELSDEERRRAMTAMLGAADNIITDVHICAAISKSQIILAVPKQSEKELRRTIDAIFRHFYKIFDVELVEIESKIH